jgi:hypothetical protein
MSVRSKALRWTEHGDPILTIVAEGPHDVYRLAHHLEHGQCEFADIGRRIKAALRRRWSAEQWKWSQEYFHGRGAV